MFSAILSYMCATYWILVVYTYCICLMTAVKMDDMVTHQSCEDLVCENSNVCHSSLINDTLASPSYCTCRGEWAGLRCEIQLYIMVQSVTTEKVALEVHGYTSLSHGKNSHFEDLHISEMTVAVWNFNISGQCLLLRQTTASDNVIILGDLMRSQEYLVCVTNGFVDSCSFFPHLRMNISTRSNCIYFETKLHDESPFDVGLIIVPCSVLIFVVLITVLIYSKRHALLVQLCLKKICCRKCECCTKYIHIRHCLVHKHRDISGEVLMSSDLPVDFESASDTQTGATGDSSRGKTYSSNASSLTSRRSACSLDPDGSVSLLTSFDHNTFLYENQNLVPPLYSPQDHKVMTLTYIDEDFIPESTEQHIHKCSEKVTPDKTSQNLQINGHIFIENMVDYQSLSQKFSIPRSAVTNDTSQSLSDINRSEEVHDFRKQIGPLKKQYLAHPFSHRPYDKSIFFQNQLHSNHVRSRLSRSNNVARCRDPNKPNQYQRQSSFSFELKCHESPNNGTTHSFVADSSNWKHSINSNRIYTQEHAHSPLSVWPKQYTSMDNYVRSVFERKPTRLNHLLSSPNRYKSIFKEDKQDRMAAPSYHSHNGGPMSNTLPRSRKPRFVLPVTINSIRDNTFIDPLGENHTFPSGKPPQKPTWLDLPSRTQDLLVISRSQPATPVTSETPSSSASQHKPYKHVKNLISHFEHNLSFLKPSKSNRATDEEKEFRDLQSPLVEERHKSSKKSRSSSFSKTFSGILSKPSNENHRHSFASGEPIFEGHPSEHVQPPFSTGDEDGVEDISEATTWNDASDKNSGASRASKTSAISSYDDDDTNLVTPFVTEDSSDDDTYKNIQSLSGSVETLQDEILESGQSLLSYEAVSDSQP